MNNDVTGVINNAEVASIQERILTGIVNPIILIASALAFAWFIYGGVRFIVNKDNEEERRRGKGHLIYGALGLFIIFSIWGILSILAGVMDSKVWFVN